MTYTLKSPFEGVSSNMIAFITSLQEIITTKIASFETQPFITDPWDRPEGGGGLSMVLENGKVFEKAGVNISAIHGTLTKDDEISMFQTLLKQQNQKEFNAKNATYFATGISLVLHPVNPYAPTVHMNVRYFEMKKDNHTMWWFGGGSDLTPAIEFAEDTRHFHAVLKDTCDNVDTTYYPIFKEKCDTYFYLPHRQEARGVGGIFFDYLNTNSQQHYFNFVKACGESFIPSYFPILEKRFKTPFSEADKKTQLIKRGRYVEFNLLYDRGTLFGLKTGGRVESILMSLPLNASWSYSH
ncbi:oxygen-dependent coproporphyrinogen oxidase [Candidatus Marinamargulisbacteria bacterium SCGC AG-414-C22]|nr:oxygen-dependent coproporphyrinogen oxidase [Candidatus Marinamargulisbacteria bacterium SCGC AG-414-C22]